MLHHNRSIVVAGISAKNGKDDAMKYLFCILVGMAVMYPRAGVTIDCEQQLIELEETRDAWQQRAIRAEKSLERLRERYRDTLESLVAQ